MGENGVRKQQPVIVTVPDLSASMQGSNPSVGIRNHRQVKRGCFASVCWCFSPSPAREANFKAQQQETGLRAANANPPAARTDLEEQCTQSFQKATMPGLENMKASSGELVLPDTNRGSLADASRNSLPLSIPDADEASKTVDGKAKETSNVGSADSRTETMPAPNGNSSTTQHAEVKPSAESRIAGTTEHSDSGAALDDVEIAGLHNDNGAGSRWAGGDLQGYAEVGDLSTEQMSAGDTAVTVSPAEVATKVSAIPPLPLSKRAPSPATRPALPMSKTPMGTPRFYSPQPSPRPGKEEADCTRVVGADGLAVDCRAVEQVVLQGIEAAAHCMLVSHWTSPDVGCLLTLKSAPGSAGVALDHAGLQLASRSGSEAATVMSARQCALFRRGLAQALEHVNQQLARAGLTIKRFQLLRDEFSAANGLLGPGGELQRRMVVERYRHIVDDMYQHEAHYQHKWMRDLPDPAPDPVAAASTATPRGTERRSNPEGAEGQGQGAGMKAGGGRGQRGQAWVSPRERQGEEGARQSEIVAYLSQMAEMRARRAEEAGVAPAHPAYTHYGGWTEARPGGVNLKGGPGGSGQSSPRFGLGQGSSVSPRLTARSGGSSQQQQQRLPQSVRMLSVDAPGTLSGSNTPRDRGRYSPSFASGNVQPFTKPASPGIIPVGSGPLGLPVGGANFDGALRACVTGPPVTPVGKPPRPLAGPTAFSKRAEGAVMDAIQVPGRPPVARPRAFGGARVVGPGGQQGVQGRGAGALHVGEDGYEVMQTPTGEWAF